MDELIKQGQWWWLFLVPVATGILALVGAWWGSKLGRTTEHKQWTRNEKLRVYAQFMNELNPLSIRTLQTLIGGDEEANHKYDENRTKNLLNMLLVANGEVMTHAVRVIEMTRNFAKLPAEAHKAALEELKRLVAENPNTEGLAEQVLAGTKQTTVDEMKNLYNENFRLAEAMRKDLGLTGKFEVNASLYLPEG